MADDRIPGTPELPREGRREVLQEWPAWLILAALWAGSLLAAPRLPARVPMHWDLHGEVNGWGGPWEAALLLPSIATGVYLFILVLDWGRLDFRAARGMTPATRRQVRLLVVLLLGVMHSLILAATLRGGAPRANLLLACLSVFLVLLGNLMPRLEPNAWVGIRIPPTLENREVWKRTHRLAGRWLVVAGLVGLPLCLLPGPSTHVLGLGLILTPLVAGAVYAYVLRHRMETAGTLPPEAS